MLLALVAGGINSGEAASLHHFDLRILSHTKRPHLLLKADGSRPQVVLRSVRAATGPVGADAVAAVATRTRHASNANYSVGEFLANDAIRTTRDFALTEDDVVGVDWNSAVSGTPARAQGVTIPALVIALTCFQFVVPAEIIYDHLAAKDKTLAGVEGAEHEFNSCGAQFGDTRSRLFDYVAEWLAGPRRF
jgi:hypothetical protein